jgi:hypothetical protein
MSPTVRATLLLGLTAMPALLLGLSCSGDAFQGSGDAALGGEAGAGSLIEAGAGGSAGVSSHAGSAGADDSGGEASGEAGASGGGGASGAGCTVSADCADGEFCRDGDCASCVDFSDLDSLQYGPPQPFEVINDSRDQEGLRFARRLHAGSGLIYVRDFFGGALWFTSDPYSGAGAAISKTDVYENGGLPVAHDLPAPLSGLDFFFSRRARTGDDAANTRLFGAILGEDGTLSDEQQLPAPFNSGEVVASYGLALSTKRAVWMRNIDGMLNIQLVTSPLPPTGEPTALRLPLPDGCGFASEFDYAPWLTPDGRTLFFTARRVDEGCPAGVDAMTHIYVVALSAAGQPIGEAHPLTGLAEADFRQSDPSLSADGCELLFSAQPDTGMQLYRAPRTR